MTRCGLATSSRQVSVSYTHLVGQFIYICLQKNQSFDIMKKVLLISFVILSVAAQMTHAQKQAVIKLTETTLMHEMRATPYPLDKAVVNDRAVSFQWPLRSDTVSYTHLMS